MSDFAKENQIPYGVVEETIDIVLDMSINDVDGVSNKTVAVHQMPFSINDDEAIEPLAFIVDTAFTSDGSATLSIGTDSSTEPDNWLDDTAVSSLTVDAIIEMTGDGSSSSWITNKTGAELPLYFENKTAAFTAGKGRIRCRKFKV